MRKVAYLLRVSCYALTICWVVFSTPFLLADELPIGRPYFLLPTPPPDYSLDAETERSYIKHTIKSATTDQLLQARIGAYNESIVMYDDVVTRLHLSRLPATSALFQKIRVDAKLITKKYKRFFERPRPYQVDSQIEPCTSVEFVKSSSNPSGHAVMAYSFAIVLLELLPDNAEEILARAEQHSQNRVLCGMHYPFAVRSGQILGTEIGLEVLRSSEYQPFIQAARVELRRELYVISTTQR